jgi:diguanylate cyclase (GGDEF)-like protein
VIKVKKVDTVFKSNNTEIRDFIFLSVPERYKSEFNIDVNRINVARAIVTSKTFIFIETILLVVSLITKKQESLKVPNIYYEAMYIIMLIVMAVFLAVFIKLEKNIPEKWTNIQIAGTSFGVFILLWCAGISLLDQLSYGGQVIVYVVAVVSIAVTPFYKPVILLVIYSVAHILFLVLMPYFQKSSGILFGNYINSTSFLIISWAISYMRYKNRIEEFNNKKIIQEKSNELERLNKELEKLSQTDGLTGIFNRFMFDNTIKKEWDRCKRQFKPLSLIIIDIDYFKAYNDNYGHQAGDDCIRKVTGVLSNCARRSSDTVARYGGEEFAVILPYSDKENAYSLAEQMRRNVEKLNIEHAHSYTTGCVTISLGVNTVIPSDKSSIDEFIRTTDKALYKAKEKNRNNVVIA